MPLMRFAAVANEGKTQVVFAQGATSGNLKAAFFISNYTHKLFLGLGIDNATVANSTRLPGGWNQAKHPKCAQ